MRKKLPTLILALLMPVVCVAQHKPYHGDGIDDYLRFVPVVSAYALKAAGVDSRSPWKRLLVNTATSFAIDAAFTYGLKFTVKSTRPDGTDCHSFPSGHTSFAFFGAAIGVLSVEAGYWLGDKITGWDDDVSLAVSPMGVALVVEL